MMEPPAVEQIITLRFHLANRIQVVAWRLLQTQLHHRRQLRRHMETDLSIPCVISRLFTVLISPVKFTEPLYRYRPVL